MELSNCKTHMVNANGLFPNTWKTMMINGEGWWDFVVVDSTKNGSAHCKPVTNRGSFMVDDGYIMMMVWKLVIGMIDGG